MSRSRQYSSGNFVHSDRTCRTISCCADVKSKFKTLSRLLEQLSCFHTPHSGLHQREPRRAQRANRQDFLSSHHRLSCTQDRVEMSRRRALFVLGEYSSSLRRRRVTSKFYAALRKTQKASDVAVRNNSLDQKAGKSKGHLRRHLIVRALHDLMVAKGYAETSLSDLAEAVGMSVSHVLYYFDSKEAVLEELRRKINTRFLARLHAPNDDSPEQRIAALVDHIFTGRGRPRQEYRLTAE